MALHFRLSVGLLLIRLMQITSIVVTFPLSLKSMLFWKFLFLLKYKKKDSLKIYLEACSKEVHRVLDNPPIYIFLRVVLPTIVYIFFFFFPKIYYLLGSFH